MEKVRQIIESLSAEERRALLLELLTPELKNLDGERCVLNEEREIIGYIMSADHRDDLIPAEVLDRLGADASRCRPVAQIMKDHQERLQTEV